MTVKYADWIGGAAGSGDGSSFANRSGGIPTLAAGDVLRVRGNIVPITAIPSSANLTWTNKSLSVTISVSGITKPIYLDGAWTPSASVTCTTSTTRKEGSNSSSIAIAAAFTTGLAAYYATGTLDLSSYQNVDLWIQPSAAVAANVIQIQLCSDTVGAVAVNSLTIPHNMTASSWHCVRLPNGGALGNSIKSINLTCLSDPGTVTFLVDNVIACNDFGLKSVIGKNGGGNNAAGTADYALYSLKSLNDTTAVIDTGPSSAQGSGRGYSGVTETVAGYFANPDRVTNALIGANSNYISWSGVTGGTVSSPIEISGGWDYATMTTRNSGDCTFLDAINGAAGLLGGNINAGVPWLNIKGFGLVRGSNGHIVTVGANLAYNQFDAMHYIGNQTAGFTTQNNSPAGPLKFGASEPCYFESNGTGFLINVGAIRAYIGNVRAVSSGSTGFINTIIQQLPNTLIEASNNLSTGISSCSFESANNVVVKDNGVGISSCSGWIANLISSGNSNPAIVTGTNPLQLYNASISEATKVSPSATGYDVRVDSQFEGGVANTNISRYEGGTIQTDTSVFESPATQSRKFSPTSTNRSAFYPLGEVVSEIWVPANSTLTYSARIRRDSTSITNQIRIRATETPNLTADIVAQGAAGANTWETVTITYTTPSTDGFVVRIYFECWGGTTLNAWFGSIIPEQTYVTP